MTSEKNSQKDGASDELILSGLRRKVAEVHGSVRGLKKSMIYLSRKK